jgi:hypothetical protein
MHNPSTFGNDDGVRGKNGPYEESSIFITIGHMELYFIGYIE